MLNPIQAITISFIFVSGFGTKRGLVNEGTLCKSATVPAAVILCESAHYVTASRCGKALRGRDKSEDLPESNKHIINHFRELKL